MKKAKPSSSVAELRARIRDAGLRSTTARLAVIQKLEVSASPMTHGELADELVPLGYDRATVYRNLMDLTEAGLVARTELGDHVWRFELRTAGHEHAVEHPHFVCVDCGGVSCLSDVEISVSPRPGTKKSVIGELTEVLLKGKCERCV
jgi:Fur family ferric uptake transcriptional regulator